LWNVESRSEIGCILLEESVELMKPGSTGRGFLEARNSFRQRRAFPIIECNFQIFSLDRFSGGSAGRPVPSFLNISRSYFRYEVRRNFLAEAIFFLAIAAILAATFVSGAVTIIHFLQLPAA
jgi:hypothetical protein